MISRSSSTSAAFAASLPSQISGVASGMFSGADIARGTLSHGDGAPAFAPTLLVASGRGGTGATLMAGLFAAAAAGDGLKTLLIDGDDLVGPHAMLLGVKPLAGWQDLRGGRVGVTDVATRVSTTLTLVAGGAPRSADATSSLGAAPMSAIERKACMRRLAALADGMDVVIVDCGARLETVLSALTPHRGERLMAVVASDDPIAMAATFALCKAVASRHRALPLDLLVNRHEASAATRCFDAIDAGSRQFLGTPLRYAGAVPTDSTLDAALRAGMPFADAVSGSPAALAAHDAVMRTLSGSHLSRPGV